MKVTIENGNTVIRKPFDAEWVKEQLAMGNIVVASFDKLDAWYVIHYIFEDGKISPSMTTKPSGLIRWWQCDRTDYLEKDPDSIITILPPLPKHPKPEDAPLLYRYMAEGLMPMLEHHYCTTEDTPVYESFTNKGDFYNPAERPITHATHNGERVEIAIVGGE